MKLHFVLGVLVTWFVTGCCTPEVIVRTVKVPVPGLIDTVDTAERLIAVGDTVLTAYSAVVFNKEAMDTAAVAIFIPAIKKAIVEVYPDTITIVDTVHTAESSIIIRGTEVWEKVLWVVGSVLLTMITFFVKRRKGKDKRE